MGVTVVRYRTKSDRSDENVGLIKKVLVELVATAPALLRYASFRLADGVSFDSSSSTSPGKQDQ